LETEDRGAALRATVRQPGLVWCYSRTADAERMLGAEEPPVEHPFRWLHLNLSDQRSLRWLEGAADLPPALHALMLARDGQQRVAIEAGGIGLVLHDFERGLDPAAIGRIGTFHAALMPGLLVTGRYRPLHGGDLLRERLEQGADVRDMASAFAFLLGTLVDGLGLLALDLTTHLLEAEADLMADDIAPDTRALVSMRRRSAQLHRLVGGMRATLVRLEREPGLSPPLIAIAGEIQPRLAMLDSDIVSAQQQLRLLRDELDLQAAQRTNQNVYLLSILTALMMPATLVTGFFGMNTGGLPFAEGKHGTLLATAVALLSAAGSWWLLRMMGLLRRQ
jgi:Mg2+ and Co2+ transporter CorA